MTRIANAASHAVLAFLGSVMVVAPATAQLRVEADPVHRFGVHPLAWAGVNDVDATDSLLVVSASGIAYYPGDGATHLEEIALDGSAISERNLSFGDSYRAAEAEREWWMDQHIPQEFGGRRGVFDAVRSQARETLDFPSHLPPVLGLMGGSGRDVWVLRTPTASGQTWDVLDISGELSGRVEFAAGSRLAAVLTDRVVVVVADLLGVETVQVHRLHAY